MLAYEIHRLHPDLRGVDGYPESLMETVPASQVVGRLAVLSGRCPALIARLMRGMRDGRLYLAANRPERDAYGIPHRGLHVQRVER